MNRGRADNNIMQRKHVEFCISLVEPSGDLPPPRTRLQNHERDLAIYQDALDGATLAEIAAKHGLSNMRISQICKRLSRFYATGVYK